MATVKVGDEVALGALVRETRIRLGLTQTELAADAGVGRQWLVAFEAGDKHSAPLDMVFRLLRELDLAVTLQPATPPVVDLGIPVITATEVLERHRKAKQAW